MGLCGTAYAKLCPRDGIPKSDCLEMNCPSGVCWEDENLHGECCPFVKDLPRLGEACTECGCAQGPCLNGKCIYDGPEEVVLNGHKAASCKDSRNKLIRWENNSSC